VQLGVTFARLVVVAEAGSLDAFAVASLPAQLLVAFAALEVHWF
jgi:hypothetical protein